MGKFVQIGTAALRSPEGEFIPAEPIYREIPSESDKHTEYISEDILFNLFADKCKSYIRRRRNERKGAV